MQQLITSNQNIRASKQIIYAIKSTWEMITLFLIKEILKTRDVVYIYQQLGIFYIKSHISDKRTNKYKIHIICMDCLSITSVTKARGKFWFSHWRWICGFPLHIYIYMILSKSCLGIQGTKEKLYSYFSNNELGRSVTSHAWTNNQLHIRLTRWLNPDA